MLASTAQGSEPSTAVCQEQGGEVYGKELSNTAPGNKKTEPGHKSKVTPQKQEAFNHNEFQPTKFIVPHPETESGGDIKPRLDGALSNMVW